MPCSLCQPGTGNPNGKAEEVTHVTAQTETAKVFDQEQLEVLTASAVEKETAALVAEKAELTARVDELTVASETLAAEKASLQDRIDVLEAEKAAAEKAATDAQAAFDAYKNAEAEKAAAEVRKSERLAAVKAAATNVAEDYFTEERVARWAEMSQESFDVLVADISEAAAKTAQETASESNSADAARETAAFKGGEAPTSQSASALKGFLTATGKLPAQN